MGHGELRRFPLKSMIFCKICFEREREKVDGKQEKLSTEMYQFLITYMSKTFLNPSYKSC